MSALLHPRVLLLRNTTKNTTRHAHSRLLRSCSQIYSDDAYRQYQTQYRCFSESAHRSENRSSVVREVIRASLPPQPPPKPQPIPIPQFIPPSQRQSPPAPPATAAVPESTSTATPQTKTAAIETRQSTSQIQPEHKKSPRYKTVGQALQQKLDVYGYVSPVLSKSCSLSEAIVEFHGRQVGGGMVLIDDTHDTTASSSSSSGSEEKGVVQVVGLITRRDLLAALLHNDSNNDVMQQPVENFMVPLADVVYARPQDSVQTASSVMTALGLRCLPVLSPPFRRKYTNANANNEHETISRGASSSSSWTVQGMVTLRDLAESNVNAADKGGKKHYLQEVANRIGLLKDKVYYPYLPPQQQLHDNENDDQQDHQEISQSPTHDFKTRQEQAAKEAAAKTMQQRRKAAQKETLKQLQEEAEWQYHQHHLYPPPSTHGVIPAKVPAAVAAAVEAVMVTTMPTPLKFDVGVSSLPHPINRSYLHGLQDKRGGKKKKNHNRNGMAGQRRLGDDGGPLPTTTDTFNSLEEEDEEGDASEDAHFILHLPLNTTTKGQEKQKKGEKEEEVAVYYCGVADGVGGWREQGIDPRLFSRQLMHACETVLTDNCAHSHPPPHPHPQSHLEPESQPLQNGNGQLHGNLGMERMPGPCQVLAMAHDLLLHPPPPTTDRPTPTLAGSSTACIAMLDPLRRQLHFSNLGDSGVVVLRPVKRDASGVLRRDGLDFSMDISGGGSMGGGGSGKGGVPLTVAFVSQQQLISFNRPYQLSATPLPPSPPDSSSSTSTNNNNAMTMGLNNSVFKTAADACNSSVPLLPHDIILLATDGLFDNVDLEDLTRITQSYLSSSNQNNNNNIMQGLAQKLCQEARQRSMDPTKDSPFALLAKENDIMWSGGMPDDCTVVAVRVGEILGGGKEKEVKEEEGE